MSVLAKAYRVIGHRRFILHLIRDKPGIEIGELKKELNVRNRKLTWRRLVYHLSVLHFLELITISVDANQKQLVDLIVKYYAVDFARAKRPSNRQIEAIKKIRCFPKD
jgi:predicted transcriptional regulator